MAHGNPTLPQTEPSTRFGDDYSLVVPLVSRLPVLSLFPGGREAPAGALVLARVFAHGEDARFTAAAATVLCVSAMLRLRARTLRYHEAFASIGATSE